jgi:hypothetical protein
MLAGAAIVDITPPAGFAMAGFGARTEPSLGAHDPLTVRALVVDDTALVVADVIGLHEAMSRRVRERSGLPADRVVLAALHTHGGPATMAGRIGGGADPAFLARLGDACVEAIDRAAAAARPVRMTVAMGADPGVAKNRRHPGGPVDGALPLILFHGEDGGVVAAVTSYACHPVVLGADNRLWTADYPGFVRDRIAAAHPGAVVLFATGCCGDANTGHSAQASMRLDADPARTFAAAEAYAARIAAAAFAAKEHAAGDGVAAASTERRLDFERREAAAPAELAARWRAERIAAAPARAVVLDHWIRWADAIAPRPLEPWVARVSLLAWGGVPVVALPGEIFAESALAIRRRLGGRPALVLAYAEGNPGYIPPLNEFAHGGYEVDEAHRYYGLPATFAPGSAEALVGAAMDLLDALPDAPAP